MEVQRNEIKNEYVCTKYIPREERKDEGTSCSNRALLTHFRYELSIFPPAISPFDPFHRFYRRFRGYLNHNQILLSVRASIKSHTTTCFIALILSSSFERDQWLDGLLPRIFITPISIFLWNSSFLHSIISSI